MIRRRPLLLVAPLALLLLAAAGAVALASSGHDAAPRHPTASTSPLVGFARPLATPIGLGRGNGAIVLDYEIPGLRDRRGVVELVRRAPGSRRREVCRTNGPVAQLRRRGAGPWDECESLEDRRATPFTWSIGSGTGIGTFINGIAAPDVERLVLAGPGGTYEVPRGPHGAFAIAYAREARGTGTLTAYRRGGRSTFRSFRVPLPAPPPPSDRANPRLVARYAVLRRPGTARDRYPRPVTNLVQAEVDSRDTRLLVSRDGIRVWLLTGPHELCMIRWSGARATGAGCGSAAFPGYADAHRPMGGYARTGRSRAPRRYAFFLVPDGTSDARLERRGRIVRRIPIRDNLIFARYHGGMTVTWRAPDGTRQHADVPGPR